MIDTKRIRELAAAAWIDAKGWTLGPAYELRNHAVVHDVLTEPEGAEVAERCLPNHAAFIVFASTALVQAATEVDALREALREACDLHDAAVRREPAIEDGGHPDIYADSDRIAALRAVGEETSK